MSPLQDSAECQARMLTPAQAPAPRVQEDSVLSVAVTSRGHAVLCTEGTSILPPQNQPQRGLMQLTVTTLGS